MIVPFSVKPKASNDRAKYAAIACLGSALIFIAIYMLMPQYKWVPGIIILAFVTAAIFIYNKYISAIYAYDIIMDSNSEPILVIRQIVGRRETTLCRVDVSAITNVKRLDKNDKKAYVPENGVLRYSYYPTMSPDTVVLVKVRSVSEKADIFLELTDEHIALLNRYAEEARGTFEV